MPPQQSHGLLDRLSERFGFGTHEMKKTPVEKAAEDRGVI
jgi:hypothetical protein